ncbi:MAG TPA: isoprenylcysteine carboxylmethyltransferase family protein [Verrucomicrobiae bacterium]|nr:isoprenylcysteine carboxylmethyltransferase family protein [Verrucomicrobiae bacterium]
MQTSDKRKLAGRVVLRGAAGALFMGVLLFVPARTIHFWQAWALMGVHYGATAFFCIYFFRRDAQTVERRMLIKENQVLQKIVRALWRTLSAISIVLAGLDHRFGWSQTLLVPVPLWLEWLSLLVIAGAYCLYFEVMKANRFAASVIQVESGQSVIVSGPYGMIRHPMYLAFATMAMFTPLALGSFVALPVSLLILPIIVLRLLNEEKFLRRDLGGYEDYCRQTRHRLVPLIW